MQRLRFPDGTFDAIVCRWGFMFAPTPSRFLEARRVLRPGGRLALAVWGPPEDNPWQSTLDVELEVSGIEDRSAQGRPGGMFGLADETALRRMLREAGFYIRKFERVPLVRRYRDFEEYWAVEVVVEIERSAKLRALSATAADAFRRRLEVRLSPYRDHGHYEIPGLNLAVAAELPIARTVT